MIKSKRNTNGKTRQNFSHTKCMQYICSFDISCTRYFYTTRCVLRYRTTLSPGEELEQISIMFVIVGGLSRYTHISFVYAFELFRSPSYPNRFIVPYLNPITFTHYICLLFECTLFASTVHTILSCVKCCNLLCDLFVFMGQLHGQCFDFVIFNLIWMQAKNAFFSLFKNIYKISEVSSLQPFRRSMRKFLFRFVEEINYQTIRSF